MTSDNLSRIYPELARANGRHGLQQLQSCFLGPGGHFFAKWQNGHDLYSAPTGFPQVLEGRNQIVDVAFGCQNTYFVAFLAPGHKPGWRCELKDHYPDLRYFLNSKENKKIIVLVR